MNRVFTTLVLCASLVGIPAAHAGNRDDQDSAFNEALPRDVSEMGIEASKQLVLSSAEAVGAIELIEELRNGRASVYDGKIKFLQDEIEELMKNAKSKGATMTFEETKAFSTKLALLEAKIAKLRHKSVQSLINSIHRPTAVKGVMVVGTALLITDMVGRVYVWNSLERNPTLSPIGTYILHNSGKLLGEKAEK